MEIKYPIFILIKDDLTVEMLYNLKELNRYEKPDIQDNLYEGWDINGYPLKIVWDSKEGPKVICIKNEPEIKKLKDAIFQYAKRYNPHKPFKYLGEEDNLIALFKSVEEHIKRESFLHKFKRFFIKKADKGVSP